MGIFQDGKNVEACTQYTLIASKKPPLAIPAGGGMQLRD